MDNITDLTKGVYRRMYAGFIKGRRINRLSLEAEAWFWRVLATADDFGNADAEPSLCFAATVGRRLKTTLEQVESWLSEMERAGLICFYYDTEQDKYLHIVGFEDLQPAGRNGKKVRRYPAFDEPRIVQNNPEILRAPDSYSDSYSHSDPDSETAASQAVAANADDGGADEPFVETVSYEPDESVIPTRLLGKNKKKDKATVHPDLKKMEDALRVTIGDFNDFATQRKAINWLLKRYSYDECVKCLKDVAVEAVGPNPWRRGRVSWLTVVNYIPTWQKKSTSKGSVNGNGKLSNLDIIRAEIEKKQAEEAREGLNA